MKRTSIPIRNVAPLFARLLPLEMKTVDLDKFCPKTWLEFDNAGVRLFAICNSGFGGTGYSSLEIENLENIFGKLTYTNAPSKVDQDFRASIEGKVNGKNLSYVRYNKGGFQSLGGGHWAELGDDGGRANFVETRRADATVFLFDQSRDVRIALDTKKKAVFFARGKEKWRSLYKIESMDNRKT
ncbi:hypothetical protein [Rhizobium sp.]